MNEGWDDVFSVRDAGEDDAEVVYFVQAVGGGPIKIGTTSQGGVKHRLSGIQTGNPYELVVRRVIAGGRGKEKSLHLRFGPWKLVGEWFAPCRELCEIAHAFECENQNHDVNHVYRNGYQTGWVDAVCAFKKEADLAITEAATSAFELMEKTMKRAIEDSWVDVPAGLC